MNRGHLFWYMLVFVEHQKVRREFTLLWKQFHGPAGLALWHQKNKAYWICALPNLKPEILKLFRGWGIVHMNRMPSPADLGFVAGDRYALRR